MNAPTKEDVFAVVDDMVTDFLYYDRKEDETLPRGTIEAMIAAGEITVDEIVARFSDGLKNDLEAG